MPIHNSLWRCIVSHLVFLWREPKLTSTMAFIRFPCNFFSIFFCTTFNVLSLYLFMANENKFKIYSLQERVKFSCMSEHFRRSVPECVLQNIMLRIKSWSSVIYMYIHCILGLYFPCIGEMVNKCKTLWEGKTSIILWECEIFWFFKWQDRSQSIFFLMLGQDYWSSDFLL